MVSYCYISREIDDKCLSCIINLFQARLAWARQWPAVLASSALEWWILLPVTEGRWASTCMTTAWRKIPSRVHPSQAGVRPPICVCVGLCQPWLQAGAKGYPREYDRDKIPGWITGNTSGTTHRWESLGSSSIVHAWRGVNSYCQSLSGIPQPCRQRCHAVAEYEPRPHHYWTFVGPHHQRTQPDGKQTPECCRNWQCHSHHLAAHHTGTDPEAREKLQTTLWSCDSSDGSKYMLLILFGYRFYCSVFIVIFCFILLMPHEIQSICISNPCAFASLYSLEWLGAKWT